MTRVGRDSKTKEKIVVHANGDKDIYGKAIWRTDEGKAYELCGSRHLGRQTWVMIRYPAYDRV